MFEDQINMDGNYVSVVIFGGIVLYCSNSLFATVYFKASLHILFFCLQMLVTVFQ